MTTTTNRPHARGVALIEALIALVVMAFGMLALVGVQTTLRLNSDIARQRAEATRIASEEMELVRSFISVSQIAGQPGVSWDEIASRTVDPVALPNGSSNTSYRLVRTVTQQGATQKTVHVVVSWKDRTDSDQSVVFDGAVLASSPPFTALLRVPMKMTAVAQRDGRHPLIPPFAKDLGGDRSAIKPVESGNVAWVFSNTTGLITSLCTGTTAVSTATLVDGNLGTCVPTSATLVTGFVDFNLRGATAILAADNTKSVFKPVAGGTVAWVVDNATADILQLCTAVASGSTTSSLAAGVDALAGCAPIVAPRPFVAPFNAATDGAATLDATDSATPLSWPALNFDIALQAGATNASSATCYTNAPTSAAAAQVQTTVSYYCAVVAADATGWGGQFNLVPAAYSDGGAAAWSTGTTSSTYKVCRYTTAAGDFTANIDHPRYYCKVATASCTAKVTTNLLNQNFLVIAGSKSCPTDVAADPANGDFVNTNTLQHQP